MKVLGIETSCDETSVAIVDDKKNILSHIVMSQLKEHNPFGGVVPEIAARSHIDCLDEIVKKSLQESKLEINDLDGIAVTAGPGLIGGVLVGVMVAKGLASAANKPFIAVNHLEGHALTARLVSEVEFPYLLLLVSGGHCQFLEATGIGKYKILGSTIDDAVGEAFDKVAKMLGFGYPGGPQIEKLAKDGDEKAFKFPTPLTNQKNANFSFSGLKTAVKRQVDKLGKLSEQQIADVCASFQYTVAKILVNRLKNALEEFKQSHPRSKTLVLAGGVAANKYLRSVLEEELEKHSFELAVAPLELCTDNGAMIAWAGLERLRLGMTSALDFEPRSRWPLSDL